MKIAAYVNDDGELTSLYKKGRFRLYEGEAKTWRTIGDIPFEMSADASLSDVRETIETAATSFGECKVILSSEARGFFYSYFAELGAASWKSRETVLDALPTVEKGERAKAEAAADCASAHEGCNTGGCGSKGKKLVQLQPVTAAEPLIPAEDLGDGNFRFDLAAELRKNPLLNSRQALIPILSQTPFETLEIICDHVPRWFMQRVAELDLDAAIVTLEPPAHGVKATVTRRPGCDTPRRRAPSSLSGGCA
ncbi:Fe-only nitrogenase accessory protein AnfO [Rhodomicrobium vannielii ATCC 17100]|uniref:Fe-only nitrogenase accessory protein AnfO n=1 Tax=Rhodomicrobium vannielii TaxID=1069 RepID=UPI00191A9BE3|nr:Fe-only nitrogenase accessory protein AnfO [Rhodomicrobium vannielii]MBJ7534622.1 Fe-only nitrogenase accessory protein AnfO [Rhodomicrobium vannielii ATCC 17100]